MLKYKGKEYRNLEEQVQKNLDDIQGLKTGIKIEKSITLEQLPDYTVSSHLGQYFLVTDDNEKHLYLITLNHEDSVIAEDLGEYPARGPQGIQGIQGPKGEPGESIRGPQGIQGEQGVRGRPGEGWADLDEIDATPYTPTFTEQANDIKVETSANLTTNAGTPDEEIKVISLKFEVPPTNANPIMYANIFRGKNLGSVVTDAQKTAIQDGTFKDLFIGDYWVINGITWRIADMDYFYQVGDYAHAFTKHHLVMIPDEILYSYVMNDSATTNGGYVGSKMYTTGLEQAKTAINLSFGSLVQTHRDSLINGTEDGRPTQSTWRNSTVELMNEIMVYGCHIRGAMGTGELMSRNYTTAKKQLSIFRLNPKMLNKRQNIWLRDIISSYAFASVGSYGDASGGSADSSLGVRPYFVIG